jgi:hypothetical protein
MLSTVPVCIDVYSPHGRTSTACRMTTRGAGSAGIASRRMRQESSLEPARFRLAEETFAKDRSRFASDRVPCQNSMPLKSLEGRKHYPLHDNLQQCTRFSTNFTFSLSPLLATINQHQQQVIEYLMEENRVLREQIHVECGLATISAVDSQSKRRNSAGNCLVRSLELRLLRRSSRRSTMAVYSERRDGRTPRRRLQPWSSHGRGEWSLGLPSHPGSIVQPGPCAGTQNDC